MSIKRIEISINIKFKNITNSVTSIKTQNLVSGCIGFDNFTSWVRWEKVGNGRWSGRFVLISFPWVAPWNVKESRSPYGRGQAHISLVRKYFIGFILYSSALFHYYLSKILFAIFLRFIVDKLLVACTMWCNECGMLKAEIILRKRKAIHMQTELLNVLGLFVIKAKHYDFLYISVAIWSAHRIISPSLTPFFLIKSENAKLCSTHGIISGHHCEIANF